MFRKNHALKLREKTTPPQKPRVHLLGVTLAHKTSVLLFGSAPEKILPLSPHRTLQLPHSETLNAPAPSGPCATYPPLPPLPPLHLLIKEFLVLERREKKTQTHKYGLNLVTVYVKATLGVSPGYLHTRILETKLDERHVVSERETAREELVMVARFSKSSAPPRGTQCHQRSHKRGEAAG